MVIEGARSRPRAQAPSRPSPVTNIQNIASLKKFEDREHALTLLHDIAKMVAPVIHEYGYKVGTLCEMYPKSSNLLGLNVNRGQKILLRLRSPSNSRSFLSMSSIIETCLHELTHNVHGPHDQKFYQHLEELKSSYYRHQSGQVDSNYRCEESRLGGRKLLVRSERLVAVSKPKFKSETRKLGGSSRDRQALNSSQLRQKMLEATMRRIADSKWCHDYDPEIEDDDLEIVKIQPVSKPSDLKKEVFEANKALELKNEPEIIVLDACEEECDNTGKARNKKVKFADLLPSFDEEQTKPGQEPTQEEEEIHYTTSSSPRAYFTDGVAYPRKKLVANLNFDQILRKGKDIEVHSQLAEKMARDVETKQVPSNSAIKKLETKQAPDNQPVQKKLTKKVANLRKVRSKAKINTSEYQPRRKKVVKNLTFHELLHQH